jgi:transposase
LFVGDDWAEAHHDIEIQDETGLRLVRRRLPEGMAGIAQLHELIGQHVGQDDGELDDTSQVVVGIETDRGPWVQALLAAGYQVYAINPLSVARYRQRHTTSGAKSDPGDAKVLADLVRTDRQHHRPVAGDSQLAEAVKVLARAHQGLCWLRGRQVNLLRSTLREFYPGALQAFDELSHAMRWQCWSWRRPRAAVGACPARRSLRPCGEPVGNATSTAGRADPDRAARAAARAAALIAEAFGATVRAYVTLLATSVGQIASLEGQLEESFGQHPAAEIVLSQPGLGTVLGARVLAEFGDDPHRYASPKARKNYAGTAPITKRSGTRRVVLARVATNKRLRDALHLQAFAALSTSPGARAYYDARRADGHTHHQALRAVSNRLVGILHGCLRHGTRYDEATAWPRYQQQQTKQPLDTLQPWDV